MNIIGIAGKAGSGKSTVAKILVEKHGYVEIALADDVKRIAKGIYVFTDEQLWGPSEKRNVPDERYPRPGHAWHNANAVSCACCGYRYEVPADSFEASAPSFPPCYLTPRYALQQLGTEFGRHCYEDTWVDIALYAAKYVVEEKMGYLPKYGLMPEARGVNSGVVISDVRFPNELRAIRAAGGQVWKIERSGAGLAGTAGQHASETSLDGMPDEAFNRIIVNDGSLDDIAAAVRGGDWR